MDSEQFRREYLNEYVRDIQFERYVEAWTAYYEAADKIDGHIINPTTHKEFQTLRDAVAAGQMASQNVLLKHSIPTASIDKEKWRGARHEALRRLGK